MTETERIIRSGLLPESFFQEEYICDFKVNLKRKRIWAVSLDLLFKFDEVCRKHHLKYTLAYGSLLGAVRHQGFIPWDDDIDVFMPRYDYEQLKLLKYEFAKPYYLQIPGENGYYYSFAKLRNSHTTALSQAFRYESFNQGIPLDIFILDDYNPDTISDDLAKVKQLVSECSAIMRRSCPHPSPKDIEYIHRFPFVRKGVNVIDELNSVLCRNNNCTTDKYICLCNLVYDFKKGVFNKSDIDNLQEITFYGHPVFIPQNYNSVLTTIYGDYMKLPPVEDRGNWHSGSLYDPDKPYMVYVKRLWDKENVN